jgi:hypothetical protein
MILSLNYSNKIIIYEIKLNLKLIRLINIISKVNYF